MPDVATDLSGLTALVTGGTSGIGLATAQLFHRAGANVVIASRSKGRLEEAFKTFSGDTARLDGLSGDVSSEGHAKLMVNAAISKFGQLNILVNSAGIFRGGSIFEMEEEDFLTNLDVNLKGTWLMCKHASRPMAEAGGGSIVNISSYLAIRASKRIPTSAYAASKAGILGLTRSLAVELAPHKIRVNAVLPALINTPMVGTLVAPDEMAKLEEHTKRNYPIGRVGEPEDVASCILFLCDPKNTWLTGEELNIDGGRSVT